MRMATKKSSVDLFPRCGNLPLIFCTADPRTLFFDADKKCLRFRGQFRFYFSRNETFPSFFGRFLFLSFRFLRDMGNSHVELECELENRFFSSFLCDLNDDASFAATSILQSRHKDDPECLNLMKRHLAVVSRLSCSPHSRYAAIFPTL